jgi:hypothetical protein
MGNSVQIADLGLFIATGFAAIGTSLALLRRVVRASRERRRETAGQRGNGPRQTYPSVADDSAQSP